MIFIVDTNTSDMGSLRKLSAYMTGHWDEYGDSMHVGYLARIEMPPEILEWIRTHLAWNLALSNDDSYNDYDSPFSVSETPGFFHDCLGNVWKENDDPNEILKTYEKTAIARAEERIDSINCKIREGFFSTRSISSLEHEISLVEDRLREDLSNGPVRHGIEQSITIKFDNDIPSEVLSILENRARNFILGSERRMMEVISIRTAVDENAS